MNKQLNRVEMIKWLNENTTGDNWKSDQALGDALPVNSGWVAGGCSNLIYLLNQTMTGEVINCSDVFPVHDSSTVTLAKMSRDDMIDWLYDNTTVKSWVSIETLKQQLEENQTYNWQVDVDGDVPQMLNIELGEIIKVLDVFAMQSDYEDGTRPTNSILEVKTLTPEKIAIIVNQKRNHYSREILPGVWVDVYDVLEAFKTDRPCVDHAAKKLLAPGKRGHKDYITDIQNAIDTLQRELQIQERKSYE